MQNAMSNKRSTDYSKWYQEVVDASEIAEHSPVRGCMVIRPWGYGIWENIQAVLNGYFKKKGVQNAYFPLFIPLSFMEKEAEHVEGFAKECAIVTHHRLKKNKEGRLDVDEESKLTEPLVVRPTSEMIIGEMFSKWVESYRDLPLKINQWANVVRWEMRIRLFLRTAEFLWQEGHTVYATEKEALADVMEMLDVYADFCSRYLAIPVIKGKKSALERFPGAVDTYSIEAMMQDRKGLQAGTSHFLGQNFSKASNIKFRDANLEQQYAWTTSWGLTTRLIGAMVMVHGDDDGLVLPPMIAPSHIVILPVLHKDGAGVLEYCNKLKEDLSKLLFGDRKLEVVIDDRDMRGGEKKWSWVKKGIPLRIEIGPRDIKDDLLCVGRRDRPPKEELKIGREEFLRKAPVILEDMQQGLFLRASDFLKANTKEIRTKEEFYAFFTPQNKEKPEIHGGFAAVYFCEDEKLEALLKEELGVTIRGLPLSSMEDKGNCFYTGKPNCFKMIFAKAY